MIAERLGMICRSMRIRICATTTTRNSVVRARNPVALFNLADLNRHGRVCVRSGRLRQTSSDSRFVKTEAVPGSWSRRGIALRETDGFRSEERRVGKGWRYGGGG